jgi:hypothetical protein
MSKRNQKKSQRKLMLLMENIELDVSVPVGPVLHTLVSQLALPDEPKVGY